LANEGGTYNSVPGKGIIGFDARISSLQCPESFEYLLRERLDATGIQYDLEIIKRRNSYMTENPQYRESIIGAIESVTGKTPEVNCEGGISDCRFFAELGIPVIEVGLENSTIHKTNERQSIENLELLVRIYEKIGTSLGSS
jgi:succinyl-diaminopimelate desuccinylase